MYNITFHVRKVDPGSAEDVIIMIPTDNRIKSFSLDLDEKQSFKDAISWVRLIELSGL